MLFIRLLLCSFGLALAAAIPAYANNSPEGLWQQIDDATGDPSSVVRVTVQKGELQAHIVSLLDPDEPNPVCDKCKGELKDAPVIGMRFVWGLREGKEYWQGGNILDPRNGKIYRSRALLSSDGSELEVRGFLGFSLLGRTQVWRRIVSDPQPEVQSPSSELSAVSGDPGHAEAH